MLGGGLRGGVVRVGQPVGFGEDAVQVLTERGGLTCGAVVVLGELGVLGAVDRCGGRGDAVDLGDGGEVGRPQFGGVFLQRVGVALHVLQCLGVGGQGVGGGLVGGGCVVEVAG